VYRAFFGLRELPFGLTPDTSFAFSASEFQAALNTLLVAVASGEGFLKITGEVGTGKTLLCRRFLASLDAAGYVYAYIPNPFLEPKSILIAVADELTVSIDREGDLHQIVKSLNHALLDFARAGKRVVLCLDEAQAMPSESLEALRLLTNLETEKRKLVQIVLFGQPELDEKLDAKQLRQLRQRITFQHRLAPLTREETGFYVMHRLRIAGYVGSDLFSRRALAKLYRVSGGVPRLVNIVAHKALLVAFGEGMHQVVARHRRVSRGRRLLLGLVVVLLLGAAAAALWLNLR
jgi:MSHA biogenesis protein MshM